MDTKDRFPNDPKGPQVARPDDETRLNKEADDNRIYDDLDERPEAGGANQPAKAGEGFKTEETNAEEKDVFGDGDVDQLDVDISSTVGPYAGDRPPYRSGQKNGGFGTIAIGILVLLAIIGLTWYAFRSEPSSVAEDEPAPLTDRAGSTAAASPAGGATDQAGFQAALPPKAADAVDFSPTTETVAESGSESLPATISSSSPKPGVVVAEKVEPAPTPEPQKPVTPKPTVKAVPAKTEPAKPAKTTAPAAAKAPAASTPTEAAKKETNPPKPVETAETKPSNLSQEPPVFVTPEDINEQTVPETPAEAQPAAPIAAAAQADSQPAAGTPAEISDLWVVNISSTPDAVESLRLFRQVGASEKEGQVYSYETVLDGRIHHRIRVGFYSTRAEAEAVGLRIKEQYKLSANPWAVKPTVEEVRNHKK